MAAHSHHHDHDGHDGHAHHHHHHAPASFGRAFAIGIGLNTGFVLLEAVFGLWSNSMALLADAGHNLSDVLGLVVAWAAAALAGRKPSARYTYGFKSASILAALFNAVFLLLAVGAIAWEAVMRLSAPQPVQSTTVMIVAAIGIVINGLTAWLFASGKDADINIRGAYLHMAADAAVSLGVVLTGALIALTGILLLDPLVSLAIVAVIVWGTWSLLRESLSMSMAAVPSGVDAAAVRRFLESQAGVSRIHDLHIWPMSTTDTALTAHLVMPGGHPGDSFLAGLATELRHRHAIGHVTLQIEVDENTACPLAPDDVV